VASGVIEQATSAAVAAALARFLSPRELGLVAAATVIVGLFALLTRVGVLPGLVRRREADQRVLSTMFWAAAGLGLLGTVLAAATAPFTASAIGAREAAGLLAVLSALILLGLLGNVAQGVALRDLRYRVVYGADVVAAVVYAGVAVVGAGPLDWGPWAMVVGRLLGASTRLAALSAGTRWRPSVAFDRAALARDARFNATVLASQVTGFTSKNADYWVVGRAFSTSALGVYYIAYVVPTIVRQRLTWLANELLFPVLVRVSDRRGAVVRAHAEVLRLLGFVAFPALVGMALVAPHAVPVVFGEKWSAATGPLALLALAAAVEVVTQVDTTVFLAAGKASRSVAVNVGRLAALGVALPIAAARGGLLDVAGAVLVSTVVGQAVAQRGMRLDFSVRTADVSRALRPVLVPTAAMAAAVGLARATVADMGDGLALAVLVAVGTGAYLATAWGGYRRETAAVWREVAAVVSPARA
jgi:lipopolysaccharide exporter